MISINYQVRKVHQWKIPGWDCASGTREVNQGTSSIYRGSHAWISFSSGQSHHRFSLWYWTVWCFELRNFYIVSLSWKLAILYINIAEIPWTVVIVIRKKFWWSLVLFRTKKISKSCSMFVKLCPIVQLFSFQFVSSICKMW